MPKYTNFPAVYQHTHCEATGRSTPILSPWMNSIGETLTVPLEQSSTDET